MTEIVNAVLNVRSASLIPQSTPDRADKDKIRSGLFISFQLP